MLALLLAIPSAAPAAFAGPAPAREPESWGSIALLGESVAPGEQREMSLLAGESFVGAPMQTPVVILRGERPGPTLCLTAGIHGDELNGIEIVRRVVDEIRPGDLGGTLVGVPIVNLHGFQRSSRYLPDRRDLNRYFPGQRAGSSASRIAHALFTGLILHCNALVDVHGGSFHRSNLPQVRADLTNPEVKRLARAFGATVVLHNRGRKGTLRRAANDAGIPAIVYEAGEPMRLQKDEIERGVRGVRNLLAALGMLDGGRGTREESAVYHESHWVRVEQGGIMVARVELGERVRRGQVLATVSDPLRKNGEAQVISPYHGRVVGMALAPIVIPGFAAFHVGVDGPAAVAESGEPEEDELERPE
jgi:predicted deacylase